MKMPRWSKILVAGWLGLAVGIPGYAAGKLGTVTIQLPDDAVKLKPGSGRETAGKYCVECHAADYIYMQPPLSREQWLAEVTKMKKVYGAPIVDRDIDVIVDYLLTQNGKN